jgi:hypothetical protein
MQLDHNRLDLGLLSLFLPLPPILLDGFLSIPAGTRLLPSIASVSLQRKLISFHVSTRLQYHTTVAIQSIYPAMGLFILIFYVPSIDVSIPLQLYSIIPAFRQTSSLAEVPPSSH